MAWKFYRRKQKLVFPGRDESIVYEESTASGRSHKNWFSKLVGANNCLTLIVTDKELWVSTQYQNTSFAAGVDLEHKIPLSRIGQVRENSKGSLLLKASVIISYRDSAEEEHTVEVMPNDMKKFAAAIEQR